MLRGGGVNMREAQIYIEKHFKKPERITLSWGGGPGVSQLGALCHPHPPV